MSEYKFNPRTIALLLIIAFVSIIRMVAPLSDNFNEIANFSAVGAIALFGAAYFNHNLKAFGFPLVVLLLSDLFISTISGFGFFYEGWYWTYIAFACMVLAAKFVVRKVNMPSLVIGTLTVTFVHWIVADIGVMYIPGLYEPTFAGYLTCLVAAIPFELKFLYGTAIYGAIMFGAFEWIKAKYPHLAVVNPTVASA